MVKKLFPRIIVFFVIALAIGISLYFYLQYLRTQQLLQNPTIAATEETKLLTERVSKIIELPKGEDPTIATISDKIALAGQPFFANSQNGDKVLIFEKARKAIIYRPSTNKIVEVAPISGLAGQSASASAVSKSATNLTETPKIIKVVIYNGTKIVGLAGSYEKQLTSKFSNIKVVQKGNAEGSYTDSLVIDLTGANSDIAKQIALDIGGVVGELPETEIKPDADIFVILGK